MRLLTFEAAATVWVACSASPGMQALVLTPPTGPGLVCVTSCRLRYGERETGLGTWLGTLLGGGKSDVTQYDWVDPVS